LIFQADLIITTNYSISPKYFFITLIFFYLSNSLAHTGIDRTSYCIHHYPQLFCFIELSLLLILLFVMKKKKRKFEKRKEKKEKSTY